MELALLLLQIKLLRRDSLAKYRIIPKVLESLELYKEGKVASIIALPEWFKSTGAHSRDCEDALDMIMSMSVVKIAFLLEFQMILVGFLLDLKRGLMYQK